MMETKIILKEISEIIGRIQDGKWSEHSEALLLSAQGKLASYQFNVAQLVSEANQAYSTLEIANKNKEARIFLNYREEGKSINDCKALSGIEIEFNSREEIDAKRQYEDYRGLLNAMETLITAIQVQLRASHREASMSNYQGK